jgi:predicted nucleotidyltransferase
MQRLCGNVTTPPKDKKMIPPDKIDAAVTLLVSSAKPERIIMFGSYARGTADNQSDLDLCVIKKTVADRHSEMIRLRRILSPLRIPVDIIVHSMAVVNEWAGVSGTLVNSIMREGRILYEKQ